VRKLLQAQIFKGDGVVQVFFLSILTEFFEQFLSQPLLPRHYKKQLIHFLSPAPLRMLLHYKQQMKLSMKLYEIPQYQVQLKSTVTD